MRRSILSYSLIRKELKKGRSVREIARKYDVTRQAIYWHIYKHKRKKGKRGKKRRRKNYNSLINWRVYNEGLVKRGEFLLDIDFRKGFRKELRELNSGKRGRPFKYPNSFILFFLRLKCVFKIDYRTLEGIARRLVVFIDKKVKAPDYTTFQVRAVKLNYKFEVYGRMEEQEIAGDATGLKATNRGEYRWRKYGGKRRTFLKLHIAVNTRTGQVLYCKVTTEKVRDGKEMGNMIREAKNYGEIKRGIFDAGYDSWKNYYLLARDSITPVIRPRRSLPLSRVQKEKMRILRRLKRKEDERLRGRYVRLKVLEEFLTDEEGWKKRYGFGRRWIVEGRYSVFKRIFSENVYSKRLKNIKCEVMIKIGLLNLFTHEVRNAFQW
jgi:hypothetical protein